MKSFKIILDENDIDNLTYDYQMVEVTIEEIISQAKAQGYLPPDKRSDRELETTIRYDITKLKNLTKKYIIARLVEFEKKFMNYDIKGIKVKTMQNALNELFRENFGAGKVNQKMFDFNNYDCAICSSHIKKSLYVEFNTRRKKIFTPREKDALIKKFGLDINKLSNTFELEHSHNISFTDFCSQHCTPWIMAELEKILFEFA